MLVRDLANKKKSKPTINSIELSKGIIQLKLTLNTIYIDKGPKQK